MYLLSDRLGPWFRETLGPFQLGRPQLGLGMAGEGKLFGGRTCSFPFAHNQPPPRVLPPRTIGAKYRAGPVPRAGGPFPPGFQPLPARQAPTWLYPALKRASSSLFHGYCVFYQMCSRPRCGALFLSLQCCGWLFLFFFLITQHKWGRQPSPSSLPGPHSSGEGVNLPVGDSPAVGGGCGEIVGHIDFSLTLQSLGQ